MKLLKILLVGLTLYPTAYAELNIVFQQVGSDLVVSASGVVDLTGTSGPGNYAGSGSNVISTQADPYVERFHHITTNDDTYLISNSSIDIFSSNDSYLVASSSSGDSFGLFTNSASTYIYLPDGYSGETISGSMTFAGVSLDNIGPIAQTISWGAGANQRVVVSVATESSSVPSTTVFTGQKSGTITVESKVGFTYTLKRNETLSGGGSIVEEQTGTGAELNFNFDDSAAGANSAFFWIEESPDS